jgi:hypothetical protein
MLTFEPASWRRSERSARLVLARGSVMAQVVARNLGDFRTCWLIGPSADRVLDHVGDACAAGMPTEREVQARLGTFVGCLPGVQLVLVEDGDCIGEDRAIGHGLFIDTHVLRWADLTDGLLEASSLLRQDAHGLPLCGYLSDRSSADLLLEPGTCLSVPQIKTIVRSIRAVLVPMFDADTAVAFCRQ